MHQPGFLPFHPLKTRRITRWIRAISPVGGRGEPSALAVIIPNGYGHVRAGEVGVIPIATLGPQLPETMRMTVTSS